MKTAYYYLLISVFYAQNIFARGGDGDLGHTHWVEHRNFDGTRHRIHGFLGQMTDKQFLLLVLVVISAFLGIPYYIYRQSRKKAQLVSKALAHFAKYDKNWDEKLILNHVKFCFEQCQTAWSNQDLEKLQTLMLPEIYAIWEKEIKNLKKLNQRNALSDIKVLRIMIVDAENRIDNECDRFTAYIEASLTDQMLENGSPVQDPTYTTRSWTSHVLTRSGDTRHIDIHYWQKRRRAKHDQFVEFWNFEMENGQWMVRNIRQRSDWSMYVDKKIIHEVKKKDAA